MPIAAVDAPETSVGARASALFAAQQEANARRTDRLFAGLMALQWAVAVVVAVLVSPRAWAGATSWVHLHLWAALVLGGAIVSLPIGLALFRPGRATTRHAVAAGQGLMGALLIHLTGGRIETHFHVFGSLALLAFYRDWRVLVTASAVVVLDHLGRGLLWPRSIYGVDVTEPWRWAEHAAWIALEDLFLIRLCRQAAREMRDLAARQAELETAGAGVERVVRRRTVELQRANASLHGEVRERARVELALREEQARFRSLSACSPVGIYTSDTAGARLDANPRARAILGCVEAEAMGDGWARFVREEDRPRVRDGWAAAVADRAEFTQVYRVRAGDGAERWVNDRAAPMHDDHGRFIGHVGTLHDITEWNLAKRRLAHQATHDALTGLPNRELFQRRLAQAVAEARAGADGGAFALLLVDLDRFKEINDTFGHHYGDAVLRQLNPRLREAIGPDDLVARLGGDEFAALLAGADAPAAAAAAGRMLEALKRPIVVEGRPLDVGASIGIAVHPDHGADAITLLRHADVAMYAAKRSRAGHAVYAPGQAGFTPQRLALVGELRRAIEGGELVLHYQPKIDLRTMHADGAEALVRWAHPRDGMIPPGQFIPLAEHTGLIRPLGAWAVRRAWEQGRRLRGRGLSADIAVNLAPENLLDEALIDDLCDLAAAETGGAGLTIEITESAMVADPAGARETLRRLHDLGIRIAIDDFGTGYSSLAYLKTLPVDEIKIDRGFVADMRSSGKDACIVRSVIDLGRNMGLRVVAEGVEDRPTLDLLAAWGCDVAQGYFFSRPLPVAEFERWMADRIAPGPHPDWHPSRSASLPSPEPEPALP